LTERTDEVLRAEAKDPTHKGEYLTDVRVGGQVVKMGWIIYCVEQMDEILLGVMQENDTASLHHLFLV